ncbi:MAG: N-acetyl-gamma-glutamyl-phosphate reductase [Clostridiales bacterium]|nr:N-acetyl-gamma-glutamyl-phosphate reductase [Clostridiales bacterium]
MTKVFIDGSAGTTGLKIKDRLQDRSDLTLLSLPEEFRKDALKRKEIINQADIVFLCLPDAAAVESVGLIENPNVKVIDTSTAHRTNPSWAYGFPELDGQREIIKNSFRIANPGCHASGFISLVEPLVKNGLIDKDAYLTCFSLTGYTGGGKKMIAEYESGDRPVLYDAPRQYGLTQQHKHLPEMSAVCGLNNLPCFCPIVAPFDCGMEVTVPLFKKDLKGCISDIEEVYKNTYTGKVVAFKKADEGGFLSANAYSKKDGMEVSVFGNDDRILLVSRFDNLGKGASGAAIQNMNILLGVDETTGLDL